MACRLCLSYMIDMISVQPILSDPFYTDVRWPALKTLYVPIVQTLYKILSKINPLDTYIIQKSTEMYVINNNDMIEYATQDELRWYYMYKFIERYKAREEISSILELLEDSSIAGPTICKRWIGYWIYRFWDVHQSVHVEHRTKTPRYTGPPIGMKVNLPTFITQNPAQPVISSSGASMQINDELYI